MKPIAINTNLDYPLYVYFEKPPRKVAESHELHMSLFNTTGYCLEIMCSYCPIYKECYINDSLLHLFPELLKANPEYFI